MRVDAEDLAGYMGEAPVDIGHDVSIRLFFDKEGRRAGLFEAHKDKEGFPCIGNVCFVIPGVVERTGERPMWDVVQVDPLTLSPSILCRSCGKHGHITDGRWIPC